MPLDILKSPATLDGFLMFLLLVWLGGSATMTVIAIMAERRQETVKAGSRPRPSRPVARH